MLNRVTVSVLLIDSSTGSPFLVLKEVDGERGIPIEIGALEAYGIVYELKGIKPARPMSHDLLKNLMEQLNASVNKIVVTDLMDDTYYASIHIHYEDTELVVDARPSDAIALSLRTNAPIFVEESVFIAVSKMLSPTTFEDKTERGEGWRRILEELDSDKFGHS
jgi:bifunctional DNase/RNase